MAGVELPRGSIAIIDTSVIYAMGGPSNDKYQAFEAYVTRREIAVRIPDHVAEELGESPEVYRYQRDRFTASQPRTSPRTKSRRPTPSCLGSRINTRSKNHAR